MGWSSARKATNKTDPAKDIRFGDRVRILSGPWVGHEGTYFEDRNGFKPRRVVRLDNEEEAFVTKDCQWERIRKAA
jgi:hypothetical protein